MSDDNTTRKYSIDSILEDPWLVGTIEILRDIYMHWQPAFNQYFTELYQERKASKVDQSTIQSLLVFNGLCEEAKIYCLQQKHPQLNEKQCRGLIKANAKLNTPEAEKIFFHKYIVELANKDLVSRVRQKIRRPNQQRGKVIQAYDRWKQSVNNILRNNRSIQEEPLHKKIFDKLSDPDTPYGAIVTVNYAKTQDAFKNLLYK